MSRDQQDHSEHIKKFLNSDVGKAMVEYTHGPDTRPYAAVIRWKDVADGDGISIQEYFHSVQEARAWIAQQKHDPIRYGWEVMKYV